MKKIYILFIVLFSLQSFSQRDYSRYYNSWRLGLNLGGAWQTADYRSCWGMAGGLTLEKGLHENSSNVFSFAIRGRYFAANTYGMDYNRNYEVKTNDAYNGKYDAAVNFVDSVKVGKQYVYDNYKMTLGEGSLELQLTFNRLRERTHVLLNLWGGVGFTSYRTKSDLLDGNKKMYDFSLVDSTGNRTKTLNSYNGLIDKNYESYAYGSRNGNLVTFSPSAGIGLGYQFSPGFSMLWEYKVTFPIGTNADLLDGKLSMNNDAVAGSNDYYHYTGLNLVFTLRGKHKTTTPKDETVYTPTTAPTNTTSVPAASLTPTASVVSNPLPTSTVSPLPPKEPKPVITFINPPSNAFAVNSKQYKISAQVLNVASSNKIQFKLNGVAHSDFTYNAQSRVLEYITTLNNGSNSVQIIASNTAGTDNKLTSVVYQQPKVAGDAPLVSYINPVQPGTIVSLKTATIIAQVLNVPAQKNITVYLNGIATPFNYNAVSKQINFVAELNDGSNAISIKANNSIGEDIKTSSIIFKVNKPAGATPLVNLISPAMEMINTDISLYNFKLSVLNVASKNDISIMLNGVQVNSFTYDMTSKLANLSTNLAIGNNTLVVKGTNSFGTDSKTIRVNYKQRIELKMPPVITINNPVVSPATTAIINYVFKANVTNVNAKSQLVVKVNGNIVPNYAFTPPNVICPAVLNQGNNIFEITATNNDGTATSNAIVNYKLKVVAIPPVVNLLSPSSLMNAADNSQYNFKLSVLNVNSKADVEVFFNGASQSGFSFDPATKEVFFQTTLATGENTLTVKGTNQFGSDSKQVIMKYTPRVSLKLPPVVTISNPASATTISSDQDFAFKANITNMESSSGIEVKFNGNVTTNFTYDGINLSFPSILVQGNNMFEIKATNNDGTDKKSVVVTYTMRQLALPPIITFMNPANLNGSTQNENYVYKATIKNMPNTSGMTIKHNGVTINNYVYDGLNFTFTAVLSKGQNTLEISVTNKDGVDVKTAIVNYRPLVKPPTVVIVQPSLTPTVNVASYNFVFKAFNVVQNQIKVTLNGNAITAFTFVNSEGKFTANLNAGDNSLIVKATNPDGTATKTGTVIYVILKDTSSTNNPNGNTTYTTDNPKDVIAICHYPPRDTQNPQTIFISPSAWLAHQAHGDSMGECPVRTDSLKVNPKPLKNNSEELPTTPRRPR